MVYVTAGMCFIIIFYLLKSLIEAGQPVFDALNKGAVDQIQAWQVGVILMAVIAAASLVFMLQLLKSIWDVVFKKGCDDAAKGIVEWIEK